MATSQVEIIADFGRRHISEVGAEVKYLGASGDWDRYEVRLPGLAVALEGCHKSIDGRLPVEVVLSPQVLRGMDQGDRSAVLAWLVERGYVSRRAASKV